MNAHRKEWPLGSYFIEVSRLGQRLSAVFSKKFLNFVRGKSKAPLASPFAGQRIAFLYLFRMGPLYSHSWKGYTKPNHKAFSDFPRKR
jgi:hypothetical protein